MGERTTKERMMNNRIVRGKGVRVFVSLNNTDHWNMYMQRHVDLLHFRFVSTKVKDVTSCLAGQQHTVQNSMLC